MVFTCSHSGQGTAWGTGSSPVPLSPAATEPISPHSLCAWREWVTAPPAQISFSWSSKVHYTPFISGEVYS